MASWEIKVIWVLNNHRDNIISQQQKWDSEKAEAQVNCVTC